MVNEEPLREGESVSEDSVMGKNSSLSIIHVTVFTQQ